MQDTPSGVPPARPSPHASDPTLVQRCLDGDQAAWDELVERYGRLIYSVARRYGLSEEDASDVLQNVLVITLKNLRQLRRQDHLSAWLITIAHHEALRCLRGQAYTVSDDWPFVDKPLPILEGELRQIASGEILQQALDRLEPTERQVLLALLDDPSPSYDQIAAALQIPRGSIGYWRKRALERLKQFLEELGFFS